GQLLRREGADREDRPGRDELELTVKEAGTGLDLVGPGVPVPRRPALEDVADEDLAPRAPDREEEQVQELSGRPDERPPGPVLLAAGRLAHNDEIGRGVPFPEDHVLPSFVQRARGAPGDLLREDAECVAGGSGPYGGAPNGSVHGRVGASGDLDDRIVASGNA